MGVADGQSIYRPGLVGTGRGRPADFINWNGNPESTYEVVQHMAPLAMRTWVRLDGVILRQEVPFPFVRLVLERRPEPDEVPASHQTRVPPS